MEVSAPSPPSILSPEIPETLNVVAYGQKMRGIASWNDYPYIAKDSTYEQKRKMLYAPIVDYVLAKYSDASLQALVENGPVTIAVDTGA
eukprot:Nk52_evm3s171 gene=Nk52_evmTU3s171